MSKNTPYTFYYKYPQFKNDTPLFIYNPFIFERVPAKKNKKQFQTLEINKRNKMILDQLKEKDYSGFELCFNVKIRRKGIIEILENLKVIKPKTDYYAVMVRDSNQQDILMGNMNPNTEISNIKINGLR